MARKKMQLKMKSKEMWSLWFLNAFVENKISTFNTTLNLKISSWQ